MTQLFISYSRKDKDFARKLVARFLEQQVDVWIDWEDIPPSRDWWKEIERGIEEADVFIFLVSPDSINSKVCGEEIVHAVRNGKRLIPVVVRNVSPIDTPSEISKLNWIFFQEPDVFDESFQKLDIAIHTDFEWVQAHREIQVKALKWERRNFENSFLLRGKELADVEKQFKIKVGVDPLATDLQRQYVYRSRQILDRQRRLLISVFISLLLIYTGILVWRDRTWYRVWPIFKACPAIKEVSVDLNLNGLPPEIEHILRDAVSKSRSKSSLLYCGLNSSEEIGVIEAIAGYQSNTGYLTLEISLPPTSAYQLDFLPEIRHFESEAISKDDAVALLKASTVYSMGNYKEVVDHLKDTTSLNGKMMLAQAYLFADEFQLSRETYSDVIEKAELLHRDASLLRMGAALAWWRPQISNEIKSDTNLIEQNKSDCENSNKDYDRALGGVNPSSDWVLISSIAKYYCKPSDWANMPSNQEATGNALQDFFSALLLMNTDEPKLYEKSITELLNSSSREISLANLELSTFYSGYANCESYRVFLHQYKKSVFGRLDRSLVRYYSRTETCWP